MSFFHKITKEVYANCQRCNLTEDLYIISPVIPQSDTGGFICEKCLEELAIFAGYMKVEAHNEIVKELNDIIVEKTNEIKEVPNLLEKVIDGTNNILADFILSVASITSVDKPVQPKDSKADSGLAKEHDRNAKNNNRKFQPNHEPNPKPTKY